MIRHWNRHLKTEQDRRGAGPDDAQPGDQRAGRGHVRHGPGRRPGHQVRQGRLDRDRRDGRAVRDDARDPAALHAGCSASCSRTRRSTRACCRAGCTRSCWSPRSTSRRCGRWSTPGPPGPSILEAVTVNVEPDQTKALQAEWSRRDIQVPLKILDSPYREVTRPILEYVKSIRRGNPRDVVMVYIPEYIVGHWWEQLLHNQSALRLKGRLLFTPGVMVASVPWQLDSTEHLQDRRPSRSAPARRAAGHRAQAPGTTGDHPVAPETRRSGREPGRPRGGPIGDDDDAPDPELNRRCRRAGPAPRRPARRHGRRARGRAGRPRRALRRPAGRPGRLRPARAARRAGAARVTEGGEGCALPAGRRRRGAASLAGPGRGAVPVGRPGRCGGCDWQHATPEAQRALKADVVREQLHRLAGLDRRRHGRGVARPRRRARLADPGPARRRRQGRLGYRRHRSHDVLAVDAVPDQPSGGRAGRAPGPALAAGRRGSTWPSRRRPASGSSW